MDNISLSLRETFVTETDELLAKAEDILLILERGGQKEGSIDELFRCMHTIKGSSAALGLQYISQVAHQFEDVLGNIKNRSLSLDQDIINSLFSCIDLFRQANKSVQRGEPFNHIHHDMAAKTVELFHVQNEKDQESYFQVSDKEKRDIETSLQEGEKAYLIKITLYSDTVLKGPRMLLALRNLKEAGIIYKQSHDDFEDDDQKIGNTFLVVLITTLEKKNIEALIREVSDIQSVEVLDLCQNQAGVQTEAEQSPKDIPAAIRVDTKKLDSLLKTVGELSIDKEQLKQLSNNIKLKYKNDEDIKALTSLVQHMDFVCDQMQEYVMATRMYTLESVFHRFPRMVRDLAQKQGKKINFIIEGENTELDRSIIEYIIDPLTHMIRNAVDHGIELPDVRQHSGKPAQGTIRLSASQEESHIVIRLENDGAEMDIENIKEKALKKGLYSTNELEKMSPKEVMDIIFLPGFSTNEKVTDISGRGVGMNVVRENVEKINGIIEIENRFGNGVCITLKLPLTLAIIQALLFESANHIFAIPLSSILEIVKIGGNNNAHKVQTMNGKEIIEWRDEILSMISIHDYFGKCSESTLQGEFGLVIGFATRKLVFGVDRVIGQQQIVIKSLGEYIGKQNILDELNGISGTAILANGSFAFVLDIPSIVKNLSSRGRE